MCLPDESVSSVGVYQLVVSYSFLLYMAKTSIFSPDHPTFDLGNNVIFSLWTAVPWEVPHYCPNMCYKYILLLLLYCDLEIR